MTVTVSGSGPKATAKTGASAKPRHTFSTADSSRGGGTSSPASARTFGRGRRRPGRRLACRVWRRIGSKSRRRPTSARQAGPTRAFEVEYELLLTNRLVLQPLLETEIVGKSDPERGMGAGLSTTNAGFRLRYEFRREVAPYVGVSWNNKWGKTADFAEAAGEGTGGARFVTGLRLWF